MDPTHSRWPTHSGMPRAWTAQKNGPQREEVPDLLVGDGAEPHRRVPHRRRLAQEPARVEVEVALVVRVGDPRLRPQLGHVGEEGDAPGARVHPLDRHPARRRADPTRRRRARCRQAQRAVPPLGVGAIGNGPVWHGPVFRRRHRTAPGRGSHGPGANLGEGEWAWADWSSSWSSASAESDARSAPTQTCTDPTNASSA